MVRSTWNLLGACLTAGLLGFYVGRVSVPEAGAVSSRDSKGTAAKSAAAALVGTDTSNPVQAPPKAPPSGFSEGKNIDDSWTQLVARQMSPMTERQMKALMEKMAEDNPSAALARAQSESNLKLRGELLQAVLQGWGRTAPETAAAWLLSQTLMDRSAAVTSLFDGAAENPDKLMSLAAQLMQKDPNNAREYGQELASSLAQAGNFTRAASFAVTGKGEAGSAWITTAYSQWAEYQPQAAVAQALQLSDAGQRQAAMDAIISGWAPTDPKGLAQYAMQSLPDGQEKSIALSEALHFWVTTDAGAATEWMNNLNPGPEFDMGEAAVATDPEIMQQPSVALSWAESITNSDLRSRTMIAVMESWAAADPHAAMLYVENSSDLNPEDRIALLAKLIPSP